MNMDHLKDVDTDIAADFAESPAHGLERYRLAVEKAQALAVEKEELQAKFEKLRGDTRVEAQIWKLTKFDAYLDRLRESYCVTSSLLGLSIEPAGHWPLLDFDRLPKGEEVRSMVVLVTLKHERIQSMPLVALLDELHASNRACTLGDKGLGALAEDLKRRLH